MNEVVVVLVISSIGTFVGELISDGDVLVIGKPIQLVTMNQQDQNGNVVPMTIPVYMNMEKLSFVNTQYAFGNAPKDVVDKYMEIRAQSAGLTVVSDDKTVVLPNNDIAN